MSKAMARAGQAGSPTAAELARATSYKRLFAGNGTKDDADIVLADLTAYFGYYRRPTYSDWLMARKTGDGFELHSALCNARSEVIQRMLDYLHLDTEQMVELERAARLERQRIGR